MKLPEGQRCGSRIKIAVKLDVETFQRLKARAKRDGRMFSEVVNDCCKCGLLDLEDSERDEPVLFQPFVNR
jgi:hypothetical protein